MVKYIDLLIAGKSRMSLLKSKTGKKSKKNHNKVVKFSEKASKGLAGAILVLFVLLVPAKRLQGHRANVQNQ